MRVLVTGGAGFIGSVVSTVLIAEGHEVVVLDVTAGSGDVVPDGAEFVEGRVQDAADAVLGSARFDGVLHLAGNIAAGQSVNEPALYWENNVIGSLRLLDAVRVHGVPRLVFSSTANIYGDPVSTPIAETAVPAPPNPYATSKLAVEYALTGQSAAYGFAAVSLRYFNAAGAMLRPRPVGERHDPETHLIPNALRVASGDEDALQLFGDDYPTPDGTCIRDYIHVVDLATAHLKALENGRAGEHRVYNLGNGSGFSNLEVIEAVRKVTGHPIPVRVGGRRAGDPAVLVASSDRARSELGWTPQRPDLHDIVADAWAFHNHAG